MARQQQQQQFPGSGHQVQRSGRWLVSVLGSVAGSTAVTAIGRWTAQRVADRAADQGMNAVIDKAESTANDHRFEELAQGLASQRGWRYNRLVLDGDWRYVVWNDGRPMAAFPTVISADSPDQLAARFELDGYVPAADELLNPPPN